MPLDIELPLDEAINMIYSNRLKPAILHSENRTKMIYVAGASGSGKTYFTDKLCNIINNDFPKYAKRLRMDDYYFGFEQRKKNSGMLSNDDIIGNFDHPINLDWEMLRQNLSDLTAGNPIKKPVYDKESCERTGYEEGFYSKVVVLDGLWALLDKYPLNARGAIYEMKCMEGILESGLMKIFILCNSNTRLDRRIKRDCPELKITSDSVKLRFNKFVEPMGDLFVNPTIHKADILVTNS